jgi:hypothetical protein
MEKVVMSPMCKKTYDYVAAIEGIFLSSQHPYVEILASKVMVLEGAALELPRMELVLLEKKPQTS